MELAVTTPLDRVPYISLLSYKRDGNGVQTPVWVAPLEDKLVVFTLKESFKVKRVRRNPKVRVAACTVRGTLTGPWHDGTCVEVTDPARQALAYASLTRKYGMMMRISTWMRKLTGSLDKRTILEITLAG